jgi:hypothetical protein
MEGNEAKNVNMPDYFNVHTRTNDIQDTMTLYSSPDNIKKPSSGIK